MRFPLKLLVLLLIISVSFSTAATVVAADANEPNNDFTNATPVAIVCDGSPVEVLGVDIHSRGDVDFYQLELVAGEVLSIDVDAEVDGSSLDSMLEVFDSAGNPVDAVDDAPAPGELSVVDPYLVITATNSGSYYVAVSASNTASTGGEDACDDGCGFNPDFYNLFFECSAPSVPPGPVDPVAPGDLLGSIGSDSGALISIDPVTGASTFRFSLGTLGPVTEIEYSSDSILLGATAVPTSGGPGSIIAIDPNSGAESLVGVVKVIKIDPVTGETLSDDQSTGAVSALELVEDTLYGIYLGNGSNFSKLVVVDQSTGAVTIVGGSTGTGTGFGALSGLAYDATSGKMYSVIKASTNGSELISIDLIMGVGTKVAAIDFGNPNFSQRISALEFDGAGTLFAATVGLPGEEAKLFTIDVTNVTVDLATGADTLTATQVGPIAGTFASFPAVELPVGLAVVPGQEAPPPDPVKTICSSTLTDYSFDSSNFAGSELGDKLTRSKLANKRRRGGVGLFKFQGKAGEVVTISLTKEGEQEENIEDSPLYGLMRWFQKLNIKGRAFLGLRDAIPDVDFRVKKKGPLPLVIEPEEAELPADGWYYIMVMQPLHRFFKTDYCLKVESDDPESLAWQTLEPAWPTVPLAEVTTETVKETSAAEPQTVGTVDEPAGDASGEPESVTTTGDVSGNTSGVPSASVTDGAADEPDENDRLTVEKSVGDDTSEPESVTTTDNTASNTNEEPPAGVTDEAADEPDENDGLIVEKPVGDDTSEPESVTVKEAAGENDVQSEIQ